MQIKAFAVSFLAATVAADTASSLLAQIPSCALSCLLQGASAVNCGPTDYTCQCNNAATLQADVTPCVTSACNATEAQTAESVSVQLCAALGISTNTTASNATTTTSTNTTASTTSATPSKSANAAAGRYELGLVAGAVAAIAAFAL